MKFLADRSGKPSHARLLVMLCVPALVLAPLVVWVFVSMTRGALQEIPATLPLYIGTANGILLGYAGVKSHQETKMPPPAP